MRRISSNERLGMIALAILSVGVIAAGFWARSCRSSGSDSQPPVIIKEIVCDTVLLHSDSDSIQSDSLNLQKKGKRPRTFRNESDSLKTSSKLKTSRPRKTSGQRRNVPPSAPRDFLNDTIARRR